MNKFLLVISILLLCCNPSIFAQSGEGFKFHRPNKKRYKIKFTNYNNLIFIKVKLNGQPLNFLLDTGINKTVLFGLKDDQNEIRSGAEKILIKGVSGLNQTYAYKIEDNTLEIGKLKDDAHDVYVIFDSAFNVSDKIGYQIQGIIGRDFFKNLIVKLNYSRNHIKVYNPKYFKRSLRSYENLDLRLYKGKPYIKTSIKQTNKWQDYVFLIDSGSGDAIWIKPHTETEFPDAYFEDILGYGFANVIKGKRAKAKAFKLANYKLSEIKIAYPDTLAYEGVNFASKTGVIGSEIMRRFHWFFDYENLKVYFKPNHQFTDPFNYDMSGLLLKYEGFQTLTHYQNIFPIVKTRNENVTNYNLNTLSHEILIELRPILIVGAVRPNSSAFEAGFIEGDVILEINGRKSHKYDFEKINNLFRSEEGRKIDIVIERGGIVYEKQLVLKSRFAE